MCRQVRLLCIGGIAFGALTFAAGSVGAQQVDQVQVFQPEQVIVPSGSGDTTAPSQGLAPGPMGSQPSVAAPTYVAPIGSAPTYVGTLDPTPLPTQPDLPSTPSEPRAITYGFPAQGGNPAMVTTSAVSWGVPCPCDRAPITWRWAGGVPYGSSLPMVGYPVVQTAAPKPFKLADGTAPIRINYGTEITAGRIALTDGRLADRKGLSIELNGQAMGPDWVNVEVFAVVPQRSATLRIARFQHRPGRGGIYRVEAREMERLARNFVDLMSNVDNYSAARPIPQMRATLRITGDNPRQNSSPIDLPGVLTLEPQLVMAH